MSSVSIIKTHPRKIQAVVAMLVAACSLGMGWRLGGRPEVYWSMERERLRALVEYSRKVRVGSSLLEQAQLCRPGLDGSAAGASGGAFTVYMIGYGADSCCIEAACSSIGPQVRSWGGRAVMIEDIGNARFFGVRAIVDAQGERLADRLVVVTDAHATVKGIFRNLDRDDLDAALQYSLRRPARGPSTLALAMDRLHAWASNAPRRL